MSGKNRVAIIVLHLNGFSVTDNCLQSLRHAGYSPSEVIVVDNGSADGSAARLQEAHPYVLFIRSEVNAGFTGGNNLGIRYAIEQGFAYVLLLNNDTIAAPGFLVPLVQHLEAHPETGMVQPLIYFNHDRQLVWNAGSFYNKWLGLTFTRGLNKRMQPTFRKPCAVDWITGCALLVRTSVLQKTGLLAPNMFLYYEDVDLSFRVKKEGYDLVFLPDSVIYHIAGASGKQKGREGTILPFIHYYNLRNRIWMLRQYTPWYYFPTVLLANGLYIGAILSYFLVRRRWHKLKAALKAIKDGFSQRIHHEAPETTTRRILQPTFEA